LADLEQAVSTINPVLVVIDTVPTFAADLVKDASASAAWTRMFTPIGQIARRFNVAFLLLHHARKSDGEFRDSTAIGAGVDMIMQMKQVKGEPTVRALSPRGRWHVGKFKIRLDSDGFSLLGGVTPIGEKVRSMKDNVYSFVATHPDCSKRAVRKGVPGNNDAKDHALDELVKDGTINDTRAGRGHSYRVASSASCPNPSGTIQALSKETG
jgi:hypothetical protein